MIARLVLALAIGAAAAGVAGAQSVPDLNAPRRAAERAADASNAQLQAQTGQDIPARPRQAGAPKAAPSSGPGSPGIAATSSGSIAGTVTPATRAGKASEPMTRESYTYGGDGRRDPFFSLILTDDLRPLLTELRLVGILYEASGRRTVAIMRDVQTNAQYRVTNGSALGRMRVTQIRPKAVIFSIDEFGLSRQDSLVWSDTTRVRN